MSLSINSQPSVPPGFRFHPTEEELLSYYLRKKVACEKIDLDVIRDVDLNKLEPWDIQEKCRIGSTAQNEWYLFSHKDKKYPTGTRTNRATAAGFWKATGRDKVICSSFKRIGMRKTLVFYNGRAPHGQKSDWIMHEYRLHDTSNGPSTIAESFTQEEGWVICRVFKKRSHVKSSLDRSSANDCAAETNCESALDQIFECMGRSCGRGIDSCKAASRYLRPIDTVHQCFAKLPALQSPSILPSYEAGPDFEANDWASLDRLVASHLSGDDISSFSFGPSIEGEGDLWSIAQSAASTASDHLSR